MFRSLRWRIALPYAALILVVTLGLALYVSNRVSETRRVDLETHLLADARLLTDGLLPFFSHPADADDLDGAVRRWADLLEARVTVIDAGGVVVGESHEDRTQMDNHLSRPEVQLALSVGQGSSRRYSATEGYEMMYAAVPIADPTSGVVLGVVRVALPLRDIEAHEADLREGILMAGLTVAALALLLAVLIAERTTHPVRRLTEVAGRMADGDLSARLWPTNKDEVGELTRTFNHMADRLRDQVTSLDAEQVRLAAVLEHMADGVLITDRGGHVGLVNAAAVRLLSFPAERALGRPLVQVAPYHALLELWKKAEDKGVEQVGTVDLGRQGLFLQAIVTPFETAGETGYLVILQDLTRIRRLETVRRDFVSNISHELRTPLAGLKALVDTLQGGALQDPDAAQRFLKRMDGEVDALTQMVEELLELSRIESGQAPLRLAPAPIAEVMIPPVERLRPQAERAGLSLTISLADDLPPVQADLDRVRTVVTNLVHNAIKFTPPGGRVMVSAEERDKEAIFAVQDTGVGIPPADLSRIFERFYKADRARSGGGTGLGLAIARHIVEGHGGRIWAESVEGQGSTFYFSLPLAGRG